MICNFDPLFLYCLILGSYARAVVFAPLPETTTQFTTTTTTEAPTTSVALSSTVEESTSITVASTTAGDSAQSESRQVNYEMVVSSVTSSSASQPRLLEFKEEQKSISELEKPSTTVSVETSSALSSTVSQTTPEISTSTEAVSSTSTTTTTQSSTTSEVMPSTTESTSPSTKLETSSTTTEAIPSSSTETVSTETVSIETITTSTTEAISSSSTTENTTKENTTSSTAIPSSILNVLKELNIEPKVTEEIITTLQPVTQEQSSIEVKPQEMTTIPTTIKVEISSESPTKKQTTEEILIPTTEMPFVEENPEPTIKVELSHNVKSNSISTESSDIVTTEAPEISETTIKSDDVVEITESPNPKITKTEISNDLENSNSIIDQVEKVANGVAAVVKSIISEDKEKELERVKSISNDILEKVEEMMATTQSSSITKEEITEVEKEITTMIVEEPEMTTQNLKIFTDVLISNNNDEEVMEELMEMTTIMPEIATEKEVLKINETESTTPQAEDKQEEKIDESSTSNNVPEIAKEDIKEEEKEIIVTTISPESRNNDEGPALETSQHETPQEGVRMINLREGGEISGKNFIKLPERELISPDGVKMKLNIAIQPILN